MFLRLYHFIRENTRAVEQAQSLNDTDIDRFLTLVRESGDSSFKFLQNCCSFRDVNRQPIPLALAMSESFLGHSGAFRVHGGGFAGTIQAFVPRDSFDAYKTFMENCFGKGSVIPLHIRQPGFEFFHI